jgi:predicted nucleotidyltransferase
VLQTELSSILDDLSARLRQRIGPRFAGLWLYGSQARGEAGPDSDVDLLLLLHDMERPAQEIDRIVDILADLNLEYGVLLAVLPTSAAELHTGQGPFWRNVRREGRAA